MRKIKVIARIFIPVFVLSIFLYFINSIKIPEISCHSQYGDCSTYVKERLGGIKNCNYFSCKNYIDSALSDAWIVDEYTYRLKLPLKMEVNLIEKKPRFSIKNESGNHAVQIDSKGLVLDVREASSLPGFSFNEILPKPGENISGKNLFALELVYGASKIQEIDHAKREVNHLSIDMKDGLRILFPLEGDRDFILGSLALILNELKKSNSDTRIGEGQIKIVDLRFKNPVLK